ncbi:hypothetical protein PYCCODRAFT_1422286 [Trametes coccinea BRFM310]|uniref:Uncharacterized protein n=1 Tax=Trametes coccinea (strain BRFM310) TaxID=1353009 RepID=A0A1Y2J2L3_TRAC3|nr:hypothetical protein PYCCODRAFT_1422286 [Trametes coccinea BRFM310]
MPPLPSADEATRILSRDDSQTTLNLYKTLVLPAERRAVERFTAVCDQSNAPLKAPIVVYARLVGYLMLYPPSDIARTTLTREVASCNDPDKSDPIQALYELGETYTNHIITLFKSARGTTPSPASHSSGYACDLLGANCPQTLQLAPRDHASAKQSALARDNFRCMVSGKVDDISERAGFTQRLPNEMFTITQCCHIFPDGLGDILQSRAGCAEYANSSLWTFLDRLGYRDVCEELMRPTVGTNLHRLENILTLESYAHLLFGRLDLWFEAMEGQPNLYRLHAACCRIVHMSGAADYFDPISREMEEIGVLAEDVVA